MKNFKINLSLDGKTTSATIYYNLKMDYGEWYIEQFHVLAEKNGSEINLTERIEQNKLLSYKLKQKCLTLRTRDYHPIIAI